MTEVTTGATKAKTAKHATLPSGLPGYEIPKSGLPNMEMPQGVGEVAEKGFAHAKGACDQAKAAAEQATNLLENAHTTAAKGASDYNLKLLEIARANTGTALDYAHDLLGVKSLPEFVELSTAHARRQFEAMTAQTRELTELAVKVTTEIAEPLRTGVTKAFTNKAS